MHEWCIPDKSTSLVSTSLSLLRNNENRSRGIDFFNDSAEKKKMEIGRGWNMELLFIYSNLETEEQRRC